MGKMSQYKTQKVEEKNYGTTNDEELIEEQKKRERESRASCVTRFTGIVCMYVCVYVCVWAQLWRKQEEKMTSMYTNTHLTAKKEIGKMARTVWWSCEQ